MIGQNHGIVHPQTLKDSQEFSWSLKSYFFKILNLEIKLELHLMAGFPLWNKYCPLEQLLFSRMTSFLILGLQWWLKAWLFLMWPLPVEASCYIHVSLGGNYFLPLSEVCNLGATAFFQAPTTLTGTSPGKSKCYPKGLLRLLIHSDFTFVICYSLIRPPFPWSTVSSYWASLFELGFLSILLLSWENFSDFILVKQWFQSEINFPCISFQMDHFQFSSFFPITSVAISHLVLMKASVFWVAFFLFPFTIRFTGDHVENHLNSTPQLHSTVTNCLHSPPHITQHRAWYRGDWLGLFQSLLQFCWLFLAFSFLSLCIVNLTPVQKLNMRLFCHIAGQFLLWFSPKAQITDIEGHKCSVHHMDSLVIAGESKNLHLECQYLVKNISSFVHWHLLQASEQSLEICLKGCMFLWKLCA